MLSICLSLLQNPEDKNRFEEFYNKFYDTIFYIARYHLRTNELAEECAQEIMIHFAKDFHNIKQDFNDKQFKKYVKVVSNGMAVDMYRKEKKYMDDVMDDDISELNYIGEEDFEYCDIITLKQAINDMPEIYRDVFYLKYVWQYSGEEISKILNLSQPVVRKRCMRGMQFVKNYIKDDDKNE